MSPFDAPVLSDATLIPRPDNSQEYLTLSSYLPPISELFIRFNSYVSTLDVKTSLPLLLIETSVASIFNPLEAKNPIVDGLKFETPIPFLGIIQSLKLASLETV